MRRAGLILILAAGCEAPVTPPPAAVKPPDDSRVIGTTVDPAISMLGLTLGEHSAIGEPPGIGRGVIGRNAAGEEVWLYVNKNEVGFTEGSVETKLPLIRALKVIGVARRSGGVWATHGEVIAYDHAR